SANGQLPLFKDIEQNRNQLLSTTPVNDHHVLAREKAMLRKAKQVFQYVLYELHDTYGEKLELEQELLVDLANIVGYIYNMESAILRTKKAIQVTGEEKNKLKRLYTEVYVQETMEKAITDAKHALLA